MSKWIARALAFAAAAAPGTALAHHGGPSDIAVGIGAAAARDCRRGRVPGRPDVAKAGARVARISHLRHSE